MSSRLRQSAPVTSSVHARWCLPALVLSAALLQAMPAAAQTRAGVASDTKAEQDDDEPVPARALRKPVSPWKFGVDQLVVEGARLGDEAPADTAAALRLKAYATWQPSAQWELRLGLQADSDLQRGGPARSTDERLAFGDTFVRMRQGDTRLTFGAQTIVWARVDAVPLMDRVSRVDLRRGVLDDLNDRRLPLPALRWEQSFGDNKLDAVVLADFRGARIGPRNSIWNPVDSRRGAIFGVDLDPITSAFVRAAPVIEDDHGRGGAALRYSHTGDPFDFGLTVARTRQSLPYYNLEPALGRIQAVHPYNSFVGVDAEFVGGGMTWRTELGVTDGVPLTGLDGAMKRTRALDWVGGVEIAPGGDARINLQLVARSYRIDQPVLQLKNYYGVNGEAEMPFDQGRWKVGVRFASGLNVHDTYLAPKISFVGWEPHELYLVARRLSGESRTIGGFFGGNDMIAIGIKTRF